MNRLLAALTASFAICSTSVAQNFRLDLYLVARELSGLTLSDIGGSQNTRQTAKPQTADGNVVNAVAGHTYFVELRYRISDLVPDTTGSRGLYDSSIRFDVLAGQNPPSELHRANLTETQFDGGEVRAADERRLPVRRGGGRVPRSHGRRDSKRSGRFRTFSGRRTRPSGTNPGIGTASPERVSASIPNTQSKVVILIFHNLRIDSRMH